MRYNNVEQRTKKTKGKIHQVDRRPGKDVDNVHFTYATGVRAMSRAHTAHGA